MRRQSDIGVSLLHGQAGARRAHRKFHAGLQAAPVVGLRAATTEAVTADTSWPGGINGSVEFGHNLMCGLAGRPLQQSFARR